LFGFRNKSRINAHNAAIWTKRELLTTITALGIFLAGTAVGALLTVIVFSSQLRNLRDIVDPLPGETEQPRQKSDEDAASGGRDAA
jgi:hypothetical protein